VLVLFWIPVIEIPDDGRSTRMTTCCAPHARPNCRQQITQFSGDCSHASTCHFSAVLLIEHHLEVFCSQTRDSVGGIQAGDNLADSTISNDLPELRAGSIERDRFRRGVLDSRVRRKCRKVVPAIPDQQLGASAASMALRLRRMQQAPSPWLPAHVP